MDTMDSTVEIVTNCEANGASPPYFAAIIAVVLPTGIPARSTDTLVISGSMENARQPR
jgi:hypothetical protein